MKYRCLIIDDEVLARDVIKTFVKHDHTIEITDEAANGSEAVVKILQNKRPPPPPCPPLPLWCSPTPR